MNIRSGVVYVVLYWDSVLVYMYNQDRRLLSAGVIYMLRLKYKTYVMARKYSMGVCGS